jgi:glycerophosphoryl diester phosphodiesterase
VPASTVDRNNDGKPDDLNGDGQISDADRVLGAPTTLIQDAHSAGLLVHLYTLRSDSFFLASDYQNDPRKEFQQFIDLGVDGFFTDFPDTGRNVLVNDYFAGTGYAPGASNNYNPALPYNSDPNQPYYGNLVVANLGRSKGFEGLAISPNKSTLYPLLEGTVVGDLAGALRIYEFDVATKQYEGLAGYYKLENPANAIGDFTVVNDHEYLVIERDENQAGAAQFKKIFKVDLSQQDANGFVAKTEIANLLDIKDPNDLNKDGSTTYKMPFQTIEDVLVIDANTILVANDNNYPFSVGRPPAIDNNEIILLQLGQPLNLDPRVGLAGLNVKSYEGTEGNDRLPGTQGNDYIDGGAGNDFLKGGKGNNFLKGGEGRDLFALAKGGTQTIADFENGTDLIALPAGLGFNKLSIVQGTALNANDTLIQRQGKTLAVLSGVQASTITANNFISI